MLFAGAENTDITIPEPLCLLVAVEAFLIRRRARLSFCLRHRAQGLI
jgi:hypothetical protein